MTYEERRRYRALREDVESLARRLAEGDPEEPMTRAEAREMLAILSSAIERMSPERWDRAMGAIAEEAARRSAAIAVSRGG